MSQKAVSNSTPVVSETPEGNRQVIGRTTEAIETLARSATTGGFDSQSNDLWKLLAEISATLQLSTNESDLTVNLLKLISSFFGADRALFLETDRIGRAQISARKGFGDNLRLKDIHLASSISARVLENGKTVMVDQCVERSDDQPAGQTPSVLCAPVGSSKVISALFYMERDCINGSFGKNDKARCEIICNWLRALIYDKSVGLDGAIQTLNLTEIAPSFPLGLIITDSAGNIRMINKIAGEILDLNLNDIEETATSTTPTSIWEILPENQSARWRYMITTALTTDEPVHDPRLQIDTGYMEKTLSVRISSFRIGHQASSIGAIVTLADNSERLILDDYIILSEKLAARGELADEIARELDQQLVKLTSILAQLDSSAEKEEWEKVKFCSNSLSNTILKMQSYTASLTDLSRPATEFMSYDIKLLIEDELFSLRHHAQFKQIHFSIDMDQDVPALEIDVHQIQQLIRDLLENAAQATELSAIEAEGSGREFRRKIGIQVQYLETGEKIILGIRDNGPGMSPEEIEKVFQLHYTTKLNAHGLGLYNCRRTVKQHHGEIVVSENEGNGTVFSVILPRFQPRVVDDKSEDQK